MKKNVKTVGRKKSKFFFCSGLDFLFVTTEQYLFDLLSGKFAKMIISCKCLALQLLDEEADYEGSDRGCTCHCH